MFEGRRPKGIGADPESIELWFALLTIPSYNPKFQDFTMCEGCGDGRLALPFPLDIRLACGANPLWLPGVPVAGAFQLISSDGIAKRMAVTAHEWSIGIVDYSMLSPTVMRVTGARADSRLRMVVGAGGAGKRKADPEEALHKELHAALMLESLPDPLAAKPQRRFAAQGGRGRSKRVASESAGAPSGSTRGPTETPPAPLEEDAARSGGIDEDDEWHDHAAPILVGDGRMDGALISLGALESMIEESDEGTFAERAPPQAEDATDDAGQAGATSSSSACASSAAGGVPDADVVGVVGEVLAGVCAAAGIQEKADEAHSLSSSASVAALAAAMPSEPAAAPVADPVVGAPLPGGPPGWTKTGLGYTFDPDRRMSGRITSWKNNCSMSCRLHKMCSLALRRHEAMDAELMRWLAAGKSVASASEHKKRWPLND